jgi:hypothetical protein
VATNLPQGQNQADHLLLLSELVPEPALAPHSPVFLRQKGSKQPAPLVQALAVPQSQKDSPIAAAPAESPAVLALVHWSLQQPPVVSTIAFPGISPSEMPAVYDRRHSKAMAFLPQSILPSTLYSHRRSFAAGEY